MIFCPVPVRLVTPGFALQRLFCFNQLMNVYKCLLLSALLLMPLGVVAEQSVHFSLPDVAPWAQMNDDGEPYGLLIDLLQKLEAASGVTLTYHVRPYARVQRELVRGETDFSFLFDFPGATQLVAHSEEVITLRTLVLGRAEADAIDSLDALAGQRVAYIRGAYYGADFVEHTGLEQVPVRDFRHGLELLKSQRIHAIVSGEMAVVAQYDPDRDPPLRVKMELESASGRLFLSQASPHKDSLPALIQALDYLREQGELDKLFGQRFTDSVQSPGTP